MAAFPLLASISWAMSLFAVYHLSFLIQHIFCYARIFKYLHSPYFYLCGCSPSVSRWRLMASRFTCHWIWRFWNGRMKLVKSYHTLRFLQLLNFTTYMGLTATHPIVFGTFSFFLLLVLIISFANFYLVFGFTGKIARYFF